MCHEKVDGVGVGGVEKEELKEDEGSPIKVCRPFWEKGEVAFCCCVGKLLGNFFRQGTEVGMVDLNVFDVTG